MVDVVEDIPISVLNVSPKFQDQVYIPQALAEQVGENTLELINIYTDPEGLQRTKKPAVSKDEASKTSDSSSSDSPPSDQSQKPLGD